MLFAALASWPGRTVSEVYAVCYVMRSSASKYGNFLDLCTKHMENATFCAKNHILLNGSRPKCVICLDLVNITMSIMSLAYGSSLVGGGSSK